MLTEKLRAAMPSSPRSNQQRSFGFINEKNVIVGIIVVNGIVFLTWRFAYLQLRSNHDQRLLEFMTKNFSTYLRAVGCRRHTLTVVSVVSWNGVVRDNRVWTLLTSAFSHFDLTHFLINNFVLYSFGEPVHLLAGTEQQRWLPAFRSTRSQSNRSASVRSIISR